MYEIINCHSHIFTLKNVPNGFVRGLVKIARSKIGNKTVQYILSSVIPIDNKDILDRYAKFIKVGGNKSQKDIFDKMEGYYPANTKFVVLSMDMDFMGAGNAKENFTKQLKELAVLKADSRYKDRIFPFICADPRRKGIHNLVKEYVEEHGFAGIKIYPPLGYYPFDDRLDKVYRYAIEKNLPVISHCTPHGVFYLGTIRKDWHRKDIQNKIHHNGNIYTSWFTNPLSGKTEKKKTIRFRRKNKRIICSKFSHPVNYEVLLNKYNGEFKNLKLNLAHLGGSQELYKYLSDHSNDKEKKRTWFSIIKKLIREYPNVYTDVSYTLADKNLIPLISVGLLEHPDVKKKVLFGSDYYMANIEGDEYLFSMTLRHELKENKYKLIAHDNPRDFLII